VRIFIEPPTSGAQSIQALDEHFEVLRGSADRLCAPGGTINDRAVVSVDLPDLAKALAVFGKAEMRAVLDSDKFEIPGLYGRDQ
jgi:hypothetical protein